eukprot:TRINITY_DN3368_c0_g2_i1.p1 TRINITY_DN3368_c0_g2~~TRINITY_DN3368_c0_g2_i1.p1  ORF type:complete len:188 (-),score=12.90 TRINITY_DN3368_c0_g2_i1:49-612(-)
MNFNLGSLFGGALVIPSVTFWTIAGLEIVSLILNIAGLSAQSPGTFYAGLAFIFLAGILCILHWRCAPRLLDRAPFVSIMVGMLSISSLLYWLFVDTDSVFKDCKNDTCTKTIPFVYIVGVGIIGAQYFVSAYLLWIHRSIRTGDWDPSRNSSQRSFLPMTSRENVDPLDETSDNQSLTSENDRPVL